MQKIKSIITGVAVFVTAVLPVAAVPAAQDFPLTSALAAANLSTNTSSTTGSVAVTPNKDAMITLTIASLAAAGSVGSNATVGIDALYGPSGTQRTTSQPLICSFTGLNGSNTVKSFYFSQTNFVGATGLAVSSFGTSANTNQTLTEISFNQSP